jgi:hypothetical protein
MCDVILRKRFYAQVVITVWLWGAFFSVMAQSAPQPSDKLSVSGAVQKSRSFSAEDLRSLPAPMQQTFTQSRIVGGVEQRSSVRGVKLPALLEYVGIGAQALGTWKTLLVTATATDDYRAVFTWAELINTPIGDGVLVIFERDGRPLDAREGSVALQSTLDFRLGARHVRNLKSLTITLIPA